PPVPVLARALGFSERQLRRRVAAAFGYGPKTLEQILRFRRATAAGERGWARTAAEEGYADQAHLARQVRRWSGVPPTRLRLHRALPRLEDPDGVDGEPGAGLELDPVVPAPVVDRPAPVRVLLGGPEVQGRTHLRCAEPARPDTRRVGGEVAGEVVLAGRVPRRRRHALPVRGVEEHQARPAHELADPRGGLLGPGAVGRCAEEGRDAEHLVRVARFERVDPVAAECDRAVDPRVLDPVAQQVPDGPCRGQEPTAVLRRGLNPRRVRIGADRLQQVRDAPIGGRVHGEPVAHARAGLLVEDPGLVQDRQRRHRGERLRLGALHVRFEREREPPVAGPVREHRRPHPLTRAGPGEARHAALVHQAPGAPHELRGALQLLCIDPFHAPHAKTRARPRA
ncbi:MAG: AraC family transcriptional regulator, partial [Glycomyces artemisiae]|nr:AraC family transcriptional regulator [Glycomyces artemisiae]